MDRLSQRIETSLEWSFGESSQSVAKPFSLVQIVLTYKNEFGLLFGVPYSQKYIQMSFFFAVL